MIEQELLDLSLKLHNLQQIISAKEQEIQILQIRLDSFHSLKVQSEDDVLTIVTEVHSTMKSIYSILYQIRDPCAQYGIPFLYDFSKALLSVMVNAIKLLSDCCQNGVERNLILMIPEGKRQVAETQGVQKMDKSSNQRNKKLDLEPSQKSSQYFSQAQVEMDIEKIYHRLELERQCVEKTFPSNAVSKLNQVHICWMKIISDSDQLLEEVFYRKGQQRESTQQKINKPEYVTKVIKEELSNRLKTHFRESMQRLISKIASQTYKRESKRAKEQVQRMKNPTISSFQQTDIEGITKVKQISSLKKNLQKTSKQLEESEKQKNYLADELTKASRNNQLYVSRIQQLERKLIKAIPLKLLERRLIDSDKHILKDSKRNSTIDQRLRSSYLKQDEIQEVWASSNIENMIVKQEKERGEQKIIKKKGKTFMKSLMYSQAIRERRREYLKKVEPQKNGEIKQKSKQSELKTLLKISNSLEIQQKNQRRPTIKEQQDSSQINNVNPLKYLNISLLLQQLKSQPKLLNNLYQMMAEVISRQKPNDEKQPSSTKFQQQINQKAVEIPPTTNFSHIQQREMKQNCFHFPVQKDSQVAKSNHFRKIQFQNQNLCNNQNLFPFLQNLRQNQSVREQGESSDPYPRLLTQQSQKSQTSRPCEAVRRILASTKGKKGLFDERFQVLPIQKEEKQRQSKIRTELGAYLWERQRSMEKVKQQNRSIPRQAITRENQTLITVEKMSLNKLPKGLSKVYEKKKTNCQTLKG